MSGILAGTLYLIAGFIYRPALLGLHPAIPTLLINVTLFVVISLCTSRPNPTVIRVFFDDVENFLSKKA